MKHLYTNGLHNKRIALLGPLPPPLGGVSVHVERVMAKLKLHNYVVHFETCVEYRYRYFILYLIALLFFLIKHKPDELHMHTLYLRNGLAELRWIMRLKRLLRYNIVLIEHDCRYLYKQSERWKDRLNRLLPHINKQVYIGNITAQSYRDNNMRKAQEVSVESAFLPPDISQEPAIMHSYPKELFTFINRHAPVLLANAFQLSLLDGKDLYGFDQCVYALARLKDTYADIGFIFALAQIGSTDYYNELRARIATQNLQHNIYILVGQRHLWPILKKIDLFVRPTLSDGASVSIEEALWAGKPVVASNVCKRPKDVTLYDLHTQDALYQTLNKVLQEKCIGAMSEKKVNVQSL